MNSYKKRSAIPSVPMRSHPKFYEEIQDIIGKRITIGKENPFHRQRSARITAAITRHAQWERVKQDIITADLPPLEGEREDD